MRFTFCTFLSHHQHVLYLLYTFCFIFSCAYHGWNNLLFKPVHQLLWLVALGHQTGYQLRVRDLGLILLDGTWWWLGLLPGSSTSPPSDHQSSCPVLHQFSDPVFVTTESVESKQESLQGEGRCWGCLDKGLADSADDAGPWCWTGTQYRWWDSGVTHCSSCSLRSENQRLCSWCYMLWNWVSWQDLADVSFRTLTHTLFECSDGMDLALIFYLL